MNRQIFLYKVQDIFLYKTKPIYIDKLAMFPLENKTSQTIS